MFRRRFISALGVVGLTLTACGADDAGESTEGDESAHTVFGGSVGEPATGGSRATSDSGDEAGDRAGAGTSGSVDRGSSAEPQSGAGRGFGSDMGGSAEGGASSVGGAGIDIMRGTGGDVGVETDSGGAPGLESGGGTGGSTVWAAGASALRDGGAGGSPEADGSPEAGGAGDSGNDHSGSEHTGSERAGCKRGVAYGHHSEADLRALSPGVSWWYNWAFTPDAGLSDASYLSLGIQYVPMIWGAGSDRSAAESLIPDSAQTLLGFNEPNFGAQADLSANAAAAIWPELERNAAARGLDLASPAVNYCGGDCQDTDPFNYLHEFFAACSGCRVDYVAMHIYVGCAGSSDNHAAWLINHVERYKSEFDLPLWLTEFACDDPTSDSDQIAFMEDAVAYLESEPRIERYAWFSGRANNMAHVDLLGADGELTELGRRYVSAPQNPDCGL